MVDLSIIRNSAVFEEQLKEMPIFRSEIKRYETTKPFQGMTVAISHVIVPNSLPMLYCIIAGGGEVDISCCCPPPHQATIAMLVSAGVRYHEVLPIKSYDLGLDCGGHLAEHPPTLGIAEVTRSGIHIYTASNIPSRVINVDASRCKLIETFFGNPEATLRAFSRFIDVPDHFLAGKSIAIIGFGKIGRGVARLFKLYSNIIIYDTSDKVIDLATDLGYTAFLLRDDRTANSELIADCAVMISATGIPNAITNTFEKRQLIHVLKINLGAVDEYGDDYTTDDVFMSKDKPFNFNLVPPTGNKFIDPILFVQLEALRILATATIPVGIQNMPGSIDDRIVALFQQFNDYDISDIEKYFP